VADHPAERSASTSPASSATLTPADIDRLAVLARITVTADERGALLEQLNRVFGVLERLRAVDTTGVEPMTHPQAEGLRERPDVVTEPDRREENQRVAPAVADGLYLVPRVIE
jgi:aspartyl-tRNA(Asn)/glutamyl-tRNA(Gln) amidotransferase subunit C